MPETTTNTVSKTELSALMTRLNQTLQYLVEVTEHSPEVALFFAELKLQANKAFNEKWGQGR